ncbi:MAG: RNase adapter RapZ [Clostridia bacterium]|nr:RNase adapter RapZ [Clostridia bacterium]
MEPLVIVTGLSGAGKSKVADFLEDLGYYCVDNLPPALIPKFAELCMTANTGKSNAALVVDIRGREFFDSFNGIFHELQEKKIQYQILFLEASNEVLVRRYKESRRIHPLGSDGEVLQAIQQERKLMSFLRAKANKIIDTSNMTLAVLRSEINSLYNTDSQSNDFRIMILSFGFKYGIPLDGDLVFDVRFMRNPYYVPSLKELTGENELIRNYVMDSSVSEQFLNKLFDFMEFLLPLYKKEGKPFLQICIGCTGGKHRSVTMAIYLAEYLQSQNYQVQLRHRDIQKDVK